MMNQIKYAVKSTAEALDIPEHSPVRDIARGLALEYHLSGDSDYSPDELAAGAVYFGTLLSNHDFGIDEVAAAGGVESHTVGVVYSQIHEAVTTPEAEKYDEYWREPVPSYSPPSERMD